VEWNGVKPETITTITNDVAKALAKDIEGGKTAPNVAAWQPGIAKAVTDVDGNSEDRSDTGSNQPYRYRGWSLR
jgi:hypothetical protein